MPRDYEHPRPTGTTPEARFDQWVWDMLTRWLKVQSSSTVKVSKTSRGFSLHAAPQKGGTQTQTVVTKEMLLKTVHDDYLICCEVTDPGLAGATTNVAKEARNRHSIASESIEGATVSYTYAARTNNLDGQRTAASAGKPNQVEIIEPVYIAGETISVISIADATVGGVTCSWKEVTNKTWVRVT